jgi:hypothetical protein
MPKWPENCGRVYVMITIFSLKTKLMIQMQDALEEKMANFLLNKRKTRA